MKLRDAALFKNNKVHIVVSDVFAVNNNLDFVLGLVVADLAGFFKEPQLIAIICLKDRLVDVFCVAGAGSV